MICGGGRSTTIGEGFLYQSWKEKLARKIRGKFACFDGKGAKASACCFLARGVETRNVLGMFF